MAGGGVPYERWLLVQGGGGEIPCRYKPLTAICNHYNDKHHTQCINICRKLHWSQQVWIDWQQCQIRFMFCREI